MGESHPKTTAPKFAALIVAWYLFTLISNLAGKEYVKATKDACSPTTVSMGCAAIAYFGGRIWIFKSRGEGDGGNTAQKNPGNFHKWAATLGFIQFLATSLSYGSFALSSVSWTYCFRTLEPLISATFQYIAAGEKLTRKELSALVVLAVGIVVTVNNGSGGQTYSAWLGGLALTATVIYSSRSVVGSKVMKCYGISGAEMFLLASTYGFGFSVWLQIVVALIFGGDSSGFESGLLKSLIMAGLFHCIYNLMSFQILQLLLPVAHGVCNTMKRVFMVIMSAFLSGSFLSFVQVVGVMVANAGAGFYGFEVKKRRSQQQRSATGHQENTGELHDRHNVTTTQENDPEQGESSRLLRSPENGVNGRGGRNGKLHSSQDKEVKLWTRLVQIVSASVLVGVIYLFFTIQALKTQLAGSGVVVSPAAPGVVQGLVTSTQNFVFQQASPVSLRGVPTGQLVYEHAEYLRFQCLTQLKSDLHQRFTPVFDSPASKFGFVEIGGSQYGHGLLLMGALRLADSFGKSLQKFCMVPETDEGSEQLPSDLDCASVGLSNLYSENSVVLLGSGTPWGDGNTNAHKQRLDLLGEIKNKDKKTNVVQLPTTVATQGSDVSNEELGTLRELQNFRIFIRDTKSKQFVSELMSGVASHPSADIAFANGPILNPYTTQKDVLILITETDVSEEYQKLIESKFSTHNTTWEIVDWPKEIEKPSGSGFSPRFYAEENLDKESALLGNGQVVITDNMKAATLCALMGKEHVLIGGSESSVVLAFDYLRVIDGSCEYENFHQHRAVNLERALDEAVGIVEESQVKR